MKTDALFNSIESFFHNSSEIFFEDMKDICAVNQPFEILINLKTKLEDKDSSYISQLKALGWKSKAASDIMKAIHGTLGKLVISYGFCKGSTKNIKGTPNHIMEIVNSTLDILKQQRKEVPNMLPSEVIQGYLKSMAENFPKCDSDESEKNCTDKVADFIVANLQHAFDYGKNWSVRVAKRSPCYGKINQNSFQIEISDFAVLVHFTNPVSSLSEIPTTKISNKLDEKTKKVYFWQSICPLPWLDIANLVTKNAFNRIESFCENKTLCVVCKDEGTVINDNNINKAKFDPCVTHKELTVIMGEEQGQEQQYPADDKVDFDAGFKSVKELEGKLNKWKSQLEEYRKLLISTTTVRPIREDPELKFFVEEMFNLMENKIDEIVMLELNASQVYRKAEMLQSNNSLINSFMRILLFVPIFLHIFHF